jgi:beta-lactam-binding protein with PASTA domain
MSGMKIKLMFACYLVITWIVLGEPLSAGAKVDYTTATVPDLVGLSEAKARSEIMVSGMILGAMSQVSSALVPAGDIIAQNPLSGTSVLPGTTVDIVVSAGPARFYVPDVVGLTHADAVDRINAAELAVGRVTLSNSDNISIGNVLSQVPLAETPLPRRGTVNLVVSSGPP